MLDRAEPLLAIRNLQAWYGESQVLHGVTFDVREGEVVTLLGRNDQFSNSELEANVDKLHNYFDV